MKINAVFFMTAILSGLINQYMAAKTKSKSFSAPYAPIQAFQTKQPTDSVQMENWIIFQELRPDIPIAHCSFEPTWESIDKNYTGEPTWLREAKFGIWVHLVPQSTDKSSDWYARNLNKSDKIVLTPLIINQ